MDVVLLYQFITLVHSEFCKLKASCFSPLKGHHLLFICTANRLQSLADTQLEVSSCTQTAPAAFCLSAMRLLMVKLELKPLDLQMSQAEN